MADMTPLEKAEAEVRNTSANMRACCDSCRDENDSIIRAVEKRAAERIRAATCDEPNWCGCPRAADLIDPEVEE